MEGVIKLNNEINIKEFYDYLREKHGAKTAAVNMDRSTSEILVSTTLVSPVLVLISITLLSGLFGFGVTL